MLGGLLLLIGGLLLHQFIVLIEMGCLPGNTIELLQLAPFKDPLFLNINGAQVAIRKETAEHIQVKIIVA